MAAEPLALLIRALEEMKLNVGILVREQIVRKKVAEEAIARAEGGVGQGSGVGRCWRDYPCAVARLPRLVLGLFERGAKGMLERHRREMFTIFATRFCRGWRRRRRRRAHFDVWFTLRACAAGRPCTAVYTGESCWKEGDPCTMVQK